MAASIWQRRQALGARILEHIFPWLLHCIKVMCQCRAAAAPPLSRNWNSKVSLDAISFCSIVPGQGHGGTLCRQVLAPGCSAAVLQSGDSEGRPVCHGGEEWHQYQHLDTAAPSPPPALQIWCWWWLVVWWPLVPGVRRWPQ